MNSFTKKQSMVEETQYGCQYELPQLSSKYYLSPPHSSPRAGDGPTTVKARLATASPTRPSLSQRQSKLGDRKAPTVGFEMEMKKRAKRRAVFSVDAPAGLLLGDDDSLDEDYAPTQIDWTPPAAGNKKKRREARRAGGKKGASPELGVTNMAITDFFKILKPKGAAPGKCNKTHTNKGKGSLSTPEGDRKLAPVVSEANLLKTPSKPRAPQSPFQTPQNRKSKEIPSSTPGLSPLSKALGWVCEETSPTPKANMRKAMMRSSRAKCRRSPLLVPASQWDENLDKLDLLENWDSAVESDEGSQAVRRFGEKRAASESLASNNEDELSSSQMTASCRSQNLPTQASASLHRKPVASLSDSQDSTASCMLTTPGTHPSTPVVFPCGQGDPFRTQTRQGQVSTTSLATTTATTTTTTTTTMTRTTTTSRADEDDHNNDWDRTRQHMDYLMGSSCDEIDDREDESEMQQHLQPWNSPSKSSPLGKRNLKAVAGALVSVVGLRMESLASSKAGSFCSDADVDAESDARMSFPATQQRPLSRSVSITEDYEAKCVDHMALAVAVKPGSRPLARHGLRELENAESESQCETEESDYDDDGDIFHDSRSVLSDLDPIATQSTNRQPIIQQTQTDFTSTPSKPHHSHFKTPISKSDPIPHNPQSATQASLSSTIPSTQFYMDKILTDSMLESLPLPPAELECSPTLNRTRLVSASCSPKQQRSGVNEYSLTQSQTQTQTQRGWTQRKKS